MIASPSSSDISPEIYFQGQDSLIKHEYRQGQVYAIAEASNAHVLIALNVASALRNHLRGSGCLTYISDPKAQIELINTYYYPDVMVSCDQQDRTFDNFLRYSCLIVEVLSSITEAFDRGDKFADYRHIKLLQEYVLISQTRSRVECFRRNPEGQWALYSYGPEEIHLASVNRSCVADLYEDVSFGFPPQS